MKETVARLTYAIVPALLREQRLRGLFFAARLRQLFADYGIDTVIDVGANLGQYGDFLRHRVGFKGSIVSFEPVPELAKQLAARARADSRWSVHACALGSERGHLTMNVMATSLFSSFRTPIWVNSHQDTMNAITRKVVVPVSTLDDEFAGGSGSRHTYLKLDTQGFDLEVLRGGERTISEVSALQTEISFRPFYEGMPNYAESIAAFERHGFAVADFFLVAKDEAKRAMEFDCVMIRPTARPSLQRC
jgi:FkbM family methyltransferase